jgi:SAM-dependent methyltransferase
VPGQGPRRKLISQCYISHISPSTRDFPGDDRWIPADAAPKAGLSCDTAGVAHPELLDDDRLHASAVVANCLMNRERQLAGVNSYARELGFSPLDVLRTAIASRGTAAWLDLCCGSGRALIQAAIAPGDEGLLPPGAIIGVDLADAFAPRPAGLPSLQLVPAPVSAWAPSRSFDLITCVHGLHYVGDKLATLARAASWLTPGGLLVADLDLASIVIAGRPAPRQISRMLRDAGFSYDSRRHRISRRGKLEASFPCRYLGADARLGPNYTGQPAVASHYERVP